MAKNVWIFNHYATNMFKDKAGRHFWFAENLLKRGYFPSIFCASTFHNSDEKIEINKNKKYKSDIMNNIPFVFVKTPQYNGNGKRRILNMISFYFNLFHVTNDYVKMYGRPDIIIASSVHPLTLVAGIKIAKKLGISCICEIRDLWPESFVAYGVMNKVNPMLKLLYQGEKWIYKEADKLIFTIEGGKDYIINKGWDKGNGGPVNIEKVYHINNGVDLDEFNSNKKEYLLDDEDLNDDNIFKVIYTGSIRKANNLELVVNAAKYVAEKSEKRIKFLIWGDGDDKSYLEIKCKELDIDNVKFKGKVNKNYIPYIVSHADLNILNYTQHEIWKYGGSQNKVFEYFAAGKPVLCTVTMGYDIITKYGAGKSLTSQTAEIIGTSIIDFLNLSETDYNEMCQNAIQAAKDYDFKQLTDKLIICLEDH